MWIYYYIIQHSEKEKEESGQKIVNIAKKVFMKTMNNSEIKKLIQKAEEKFKKEIRKQVKKKSMNLILQNMHVKVRVL